MTEQEVKHSLNLVRYGGIVVTVVVFMALLGFSVVVGNALQGSNLLGSMLPYIIGFTVLAAILSVALYFAYRSYLMSRTSRA